jgi:hypothetical protein
MTDRPLPAALDRLLERFAAGEAVRRPTVAHPDCTCGRSLCERCGQLTTQGYGHHFAPPGHDGCGGRLVAAPACTLEH